MSTALPKPSYNGSYEWSHKPEDGDTQCNGNKHAEDVIAASTAGPKNNSFAPRKIPPKLAQFVRRQ